MTMRALTCMLLGLASLPASLPAGSGERADTFLVEWSAQVNRVDGCTDCACRAVGQSTSLETTTWWAAFGLANPGDGEAWQPAGSAIHCGAGGFESVASRFNETVGTPYLTVDLSARPESGTGDDSVFRIDRLTRKLRGFNGAGEPEYRVSNDRRLVDGLPRSGFATVALSADALETEQFGIHDIVLRLDLLRPDDDAEQAYGQVHVTSDVPGAAVFLDGGRVGRTTGGQALVLANVHTGERTVTAEDFSGRKSEASIRVTDGSVTTVHLDILGLEASIDNDALISLGINHQGAEEFWRPKDRAIVARIPAGAFLMGSREGEGDPAEQPQKTMELPAFLIDKHEVTWRQYRRFAAERNASTPPRPIWGEHPDYPISFVLHHEAREYCEWLGGRLPSEAEWEKAARGTDGRQYPWGDEWDAARCNTIAGGMHRPEAAGEFPGCVSPYGVLDMVGSVKEWTSSLFRYYEGNPLADDGYRPGSPQYVMRGGGWMSQPIEVRTPYRTRRSPGSRNMDHGFRCVMADPEGLQ